MATTRYARLEANWISPPLGIAKCEKDRQKSGLDALDGQITLCDITSGVHDLVEGSSFVDVVVVPSDVVVLESGYVLLQTSESFSRS